jgi:hypothetical protein
MSTANYTTHALLVGPTTRSRWSRWSTFAATIIAIYDTFQEALEMRRVAHRNDPFNDG